MDDIKRAIYMEVLSELKDAERLDSSTVCWFICVGLESKLREYSGITYFTPTELEEFFSEFYNLFDGQHWGKKGEHFDKEKYGTWWTAFWLEPRVRILEFILNNR